MNLKGTSDTLGADTPKSELSLSDGIPDNGNEMEEKRVKLHASLKSSAELIMPWNTASSEEETVQHFIVFVQEQIGRHHEILQSSADMCKKGQESSQVSVKLCKDILNRATGEDLQNCVASLQSKSQGAHDAAKKLYDDFRQLSRNLLKVLFRISKAVDGFRKQTISLDTITFIVLSDEILQHESMQSSFSDHCAKPLNETEEQSQLIICSKLIDQLLKHMDVFTTWWSDLATMVGDIQKKVTKTSRVSVESNVSNWNDALELYALYERTVEEILSTSKHAWVPEPEPSPSPSPEPSEEEAEMGTEPDEEIATEPETETEPETGTGTETDSETDDTEATKDEEGSDIEDDPEYEEWAKEMEALKAAQERERLEEEEFENWEREIAEMRERRRQEELAVKKQNLLVEIPPGSGAKEKEQEPNEEGVDNEDLQRRLEELEKERQEEEEFEAFMREQSQREEEEADEEEERQFREWQLEQEHSRIAGELLTAL